MDENRDRFGSHGYLEDGTLGLVTLLVEVGASGDEEVEELRESVLLAAGTALYGEKDEGGVVVGVCREVGVKAEEGGRGFRGCRTGWRRGVVSGI